jgi:hypothetical protein
MLPSNWSASSGPPADRYSFIVKVVAVVRESAHTVAEIESLLRRCNATLLSVHVESAEKKREKGRVPRKIKTKQRERDGHEERMQVARTVR